MRKTAGLVALLAATALVVVAAPAASASYPGRNGVLAVVVSPPDHTSSRIDLIRLNGKLVARVPCGATTCNDLWPAWSPTGSWLAFDTRVSSAGGGMRIGIITADLVGRVVFRAPAAATDAVGPTWSPDSTRLAFGEVGFDRTGIWSCDLFGESVSPISPVGQEPAWSITARIAFTAGGPSRIWTIKLDGSDKTMLTDVAGDQLNPDWSPHATHVAFTRVVNGRESIWVIRADGRFPRRLASGSMPAWSPDGHMIAFQRHGRIYVMTRFGRHIKRVHYAPRTRSGARMSLSMPDWQPLPRHPRRLPNFTG